MVCNGGVCEGAMRGAGTHGGQWSRAALHRGAATARASRGSMLSFAACLRCGEAYIPQDTVPSPPFAEREEVSSFNSWLCAECMEWAGLPDAEQNETVRQRRAALDRWLQLGGDGEYDDSGVAFAERAKALLEEDLQEQDGWYDGEMEDVDEEPYRTDSDENEDELQEPLSAEEGSDIECFGGVAPDGVEFSY